jgi:hypothetical protein
MNACLWAQDELLELLEGVTEKFIYCTFCPIHNKSIPAVTCGVL